MSLIQKLLVRRKLIKVFKCANLKLGTDDSPIYPKIKRVTLKDTCVEVVFALLSGMDPKDIEKKDYVFKQVFGENIELDVDTKYTKLLIYKNKNITNIYDYELLKPYLKNKKLGIIAGIDKNNVIMSYDMTKNPHLLIAGETGSGKSTQLRQILTSLILSNSSKNLELYLGDCKKSEFHIFRNVDHVKCVYSNKRDIRLMLEKIQNELEVRSDLTEEYEVANIYDLPKNVKKPSIIVCVDEFVMLKEDTKIMDILIEISAIGRSLGVFLILSMQRPSSKVIDTTIRASLTVGMGFKLRDLVEERIVNTPGASKLKDQGAFILNQKKNYHLMAPYLELDTAKELLKPFIVEKKSNQLEPIKIEKELTEDDVFFD